MQNWFRPRAVLAQAGPAYAPTYGAASNTIIHEGSKKRGRGGGALGNVRLLVICVLFLALLTVAAIVLSVMAITRENKVEKRDNNQYPYPYPYPQPYPLPNPYPPPRRDDPKPAPQPDPWPQFPWPNKGNDVVVNNCISGGGCCDNGGGQKGGRIWVIGSGGDFGTFDRLDGNNALNGWAKAVVLAACRAAGITCRFIFAPYSDCLDNRDPPDGWQQHIALGPGLSNENFDACAGWFPTPERRDIAIFSDGFLVQDYYSLWYRDTNAAINAASDVANLNIIFGVGPPGDDRCLERYFARIGVTFNGNYYGDHDGTVSAFNELEPAGGATADLIFETRRDLILPQIFTQLEVFNTDQDPAAGNPGIRDDLGDVMLCSQGPAGLIARADRWELIEQFNIGLRNIFDNGEYEAICVDPIYNPGTPTSEHRHWCVGVDPV